MGMQKRHHPNWWRPCGQDCIFCPFNATRSWQKDALLCEKDMDQLTLALGPPGAGSPFHAHTAAHHAQVYGSKLWFFYPPAQGGWSNKPMLMSLFEDVGVENLWSMPLECVVNPGDLILFPAFWAHGTLSLSETVGITMEGHWFRKSAGNPRQTRKRSESG